MQVNFYSYIDRKRGTEARLFLCLDAFGRWNKYTPAWWVHFSLSPSPFIFNYCLVSQSYIITPQHLFLPTLVPLLRADKALYPSASKVMVFLPTARQVGFAAEVLAKVHGLEVIYEIHSKLSQSRRSKVADTFTKAKKGVLLSSDVTARGMDFPGYCSYSSISRYNSDNFSTIVSL